jgi:hypothetical protein
MSNHLKRILDLVRRTGDTMVVVEKDDDTGFVVMDLAKYEILQDSAGTPASTSRFQPPTSHIWDVMTDAKQEAETWDPDALSEQEMLDLEKQYAAFAKKNVQEAVKDQKPSESKKDEDFGEEQFYLEPVE